MLRNQARHHSREDVPGAPGSHAGIPGCVDPNRSIRVRDECAMSLQNDDDIVFFRKLARCTDAISLDIRDGKPGQPCHFAWMRCDHQWTLPAL